MARDHNYACLIGRIGQEISIKYTPNGNAVANISLACNNDYKDKNSGQEVKQVDWINVVMFGRTAEILGKYCSKGSKIHISGRIRVRKWQNKDGVDQYTTEIVAHEVQMLDSRPSDDYQQNAPRGTSDATQQQQQAPQQQAPAFDDFEDDIPFN